MAAVKHVRLRDGVYQYERRVPSGIQRDTRRFAALFQSKALFRRSLGTKDLGAMGPAYSAIHAEFEQLIRPNMLGSLASAPTALRPLKSLTDADLAAIVDRYSNLRAEPFERLLRRANVDPAAAAELERLEYELELDAEDIQRTISARDDDDEGPIIKPLSQARWLVRAEGFNAPDGSEELGAIVSAVRAGMARGYERIDRLSRGVEVPTAPSPIGHDNKPSTLTLGDAVNRYLDMRKPAAKVASETTLALRQFEHCIGNKALAAVTRQDMQRFVQFLADQRVGGKTKGSISRHLSEGSIVKRLRTLISAIEHAKNNGDFTGENPAKGVKVRSFVRPEDKAVMPDKRRLRVEELNAIFTHPWFAGCASPTKKHIPGDYLLEGCEYWAPIVAAFSGCRAGELAGMKLSEVRLADALPHFIVRPNEYRGTKNGRARCVPILDALLDIGFAAYVERVAVGGADRLFPDWTARKRKGGSANEFPAWSNARVIRAFNRTVIPSTLSHILSADMRREVTFHSLRGTFKMMLLISNKVPLHIANSIIAHADSDLDQRYIGELTIEETYPEVHKCTYPGLILPRQCSQ